MKKLNKFLLSLIILVMCFCPVFAGCDFTLTPTKLDTPTITLHSSSRCFTWDAVSKAKEYEVYCNDVFVDTVSSNSELQSYLYDFNSQLTREGDYTFYIIATPTLRIMEQSEKSNLVTYVYTSTTITSPVAKDTTIATTDSIDINFSVSGTQVSYVPASNDAIDSYELYLYSNSTGLNVYPITSTTIELQSSAYSLKREIYAVRLGVVMGEDHLVCSDIKYINPNNYYGYTTNVYMFDGYINDYYIETLPELKNLVYYTFVARQSVFNVKLSSSFESNILCNYSGSTTANKLSTAIIEDGFGSMYETRNGYSLGVSVINANDKTYKIAINYDNYLNSNDLPACDVSNTPPDGYYFPESDWTPYYETTSYTARDLDFDDFASDQQFLYTTVSSSEELYWAVENRVTPVVEPNSMADKIYTKAKSVLRTIISDEMTDYEKTLSIFDWICTNTVYDYYALEDGAYSTESVTIVPAYYLEGVFVTGYAVCDGFSKAFSLMCNMEGIEAIRIVGTAVSGGVSGGHAWNKVLLDKDPDDGIGAEYYLVDITWTALINTDQTQELSSHAYFLISDSDVSSTHYYFKEREKFGNYVADNNFDYYNYTTFKYDGTTYDLVVESDDEVEAVFYYMLDNNLSQMEVIIDYDYMCDNYYDEGGLTFAATYENVVKAMIEKMRSKKFNEQYIALNSNSWSVFNYNNAGNRGVLMIFEQSFLIDADNESGHLIEYLTHNQIYGNFNLFVTTEMLNKASGSTYLEQVNDLFASAISSKTDVDITFEYLAGEDNDKEIEFTMTITPKN